MREASSVEVRPSPGVATVLVFVLLMCSLNRLQSQALYQQLFSFAATNTCGEEGTGTLIEGSDGVLYGMAKGGGIAGCGTVFRINMESGGCTVLHSFRADINGRDPVGGLLEGSDGALYGATRLGGLSGSQGVLFRLDKDGNNYTVLHSFGTHPADGPDFPGSFPLGSLIEGKDSLLYGATEMGGLHLQGTLFRIHKNGSGYEVIHTFTGATLDGGGPASPLIQGNDDMLYGVTGTAVFRTSLDGSMHEVLHTFAADGSEGRFPNFIFQASDGQLYGTTEGDSGNIFKLGSDGNGFQVLRTLSYPDGIVPTGGLVESGSGYLCGMVRSGGPAGGGNLFRISKDGSYYSPDLVFGSSLGGLGYTPVGGLLLGTDGYFYGTTSNGGLHGQGTVFSTRRAGIFHVILWHFERTDLNGSWLLAPLMRASDGRLYGTSSRGGISHLGTIFSLNTDGSDFRVLWHGTTNPNTNGYDPKASLVEGNDGRLYGTTAGQRSFSGPYFGGTIYSVSKDGTDYRLLWRFKGAPSDGESPECAMVRTDDGHLYGTTRAGGTHTNGTIFRLNMDGSAYSQVRVFNGTNGAQPNGLTKGADEVLYGTTWRGGSFDMGTVFRINSDASGFAVLKHIQPGDNEAQHPTAALLEGSDNLLYGTAQRIGTNQAGAIFSLNKDGGGYKVLWRFGNIPDDGWGPVVGSLVESADGVLYGATSSGGQSDLGTVFRLHKDGAAYHVLHSFPNSTRPYSIVGIIGDGEGTLYGITSGESDLGTGTIYGLIAPPVLFGVVYTEGFCSFRFNAHPLRSYSPQFKDESSAPDWSSLPAIHGAQGFVSVMDTNVNSSTRYYRVVSQ